MLLPTIAFHGSGPLNHASSFPPGTYSNAPHEPTPARKPLIVTPLTNQLRRSIHPSVSLSQGFSRTLEKGNLAKAELWPAGLPGKGRERERERRPIPPVLNLIQFCFLINGIEREKEAFSRYA